METGAAQTGSWNSAGRIVGNGKLSVVMPAYNLGPVIARNAWIVHAVFSGHLPFEIIIVDDGSSDGTRQELEALKATMPELKPVFLSRNAGKGAALKRGFEASAGSHILLLDGDLDLPPAQVSLFFDVMERERADVVIGSKRHPESKLNYPWHRRLASSVYYWLIRLLVNLPVRDTQTGMKLMRREALEYAFPRMLVKTFAFDLEMLAILHEKGFRIAESPVILDFQTRWGCVSPGTVRQIVNDTLAVFYRLRILKYYQALGDTKPSGPPPLVSIVVAYPAASAFLDECMAGISAQIYRNFEVILLPDGPSGLTWPANVREVPTGKLRPAEKRNIGIRESRGSIVAFIDDDAYPAADWLMQAVAPFSGPDVAAAGGPAITPPDDPYMANLSGRVYANRLVSGGFRGRYEPDLARDVDDYPSCNLIVRTEVLREIGGFRTDFWPGEDTYLCLEIVRKPGRRIVYDPRIQVWHHRRKLFLPHLRQIGRYAMHRGYFARKFPQTSRKISYMMPSLFVLGLVSGAAASCVSSLCGLAYAAVVGFYLVVTLLWSFSLNPLTWLLTWFGVMLTHLVYGVRFMVGLLARRMPGEVRKFDHASEK